MKTHKGNISNFYIIGICLIVVQVILSAYNGYIAKTVWHDEAYSIDLIKFSFEEIKNITAKDVHPPLYYFMLKAFSQLFGESIFSMRLFSELGIVGCLIIGLFSIRRLFGQRIAIIFMLLIVIIPITQYLSTEIRMYSWAMFFVLGCSVFAYKVYLRKVFVNYIWMTLFAIGAIYTHYYGLIAVAIIYLLLGLVLYQKGRITVRLVLFALIVIIAYSPWITVLITQIQSVTESYWITRPNIKELLLFVYFFFSPKEPSHDYTIFSIITMSIALVLMLILIAINIWYIIKLPRNKRIWAAHGFALIFFLTIAITFSITYIIKPISVPRYTTCILGPLLLAISIYTSELWKNGKKKIVCITFAFLSILSFTRTLSEKKYNEIQDKELIQIEAFFPKDINYVVANEISYPQLAELSVMIPQKNYLIISDDEDTDYTPFEIDVVNADITDLERYYLIKSFRDSTLENSTYYIKEQLKLKKKTIMLLEKKKL